MSVIEEMQAEINTENITEDERRKQYAINQLEKAKEIQAFLEGEGFNCTLEPSFCTVDVVIHHNPEGSNQNHDARVRLFWNDKGYDMPMGVLSSMQGRYRLGEGWKRERDYKNFVTFLKEDCKICLKFIAMG